STSAPRPYPFAARALPKVSGRRLETRLHVAVGATPETVAEHDAACAVSGLGALGDETEAREVRDHRVHEDVAVELWPLLRLEHHPRHALGVEPVLRPELVEHVELLIRVQRLEDVKGEVLHLPHLVGGGPFHARPAGESGE